MKGLSTARAERLGWYARRLRSMSPGEVVWRGSAWSTGTFHAPSSLASERGCWAPRRRLGARPARFPARRRPPRAARPRRAREIAARHPDQVAALVDAADRIRAGASPTSAIPRRGSAGPVDWNHDPVRGRPLAAHGRRPHRPPQPPRDPKWIWELNRLQHLPWLAEAWLFTGDDALRRAGARRTWTRGWTRTRPAAGSPGAAHSRPGVRAVSVAVALQGLRDFAGLTPARFERIVRMLAASAERCWRDRSRFSSANNHLVGELAGSRPSRSCSRSSPRRRAWERRALRGAAGGGVPADPARRRRRRAGRGLPGLHRRAAAGRGRLLRA